MAGKNTKVIKYRKPFHINIGMAVFLVFFIYMVINILSYLTRDRIQIFEVGEVSSVVQDTTYTGLILRSETVTNASSDGFVNMYAREGSRASAGDMVCSVDESGQFAEALTSGISQESSLTSAQLLSLKKKLSGYTASYRPERFSEIYDTKFSLQNQLLGYLGSDTLKRVSELGMDVRSLRPVAASSSGIVEYYIDGMENLTEADLTASKLSDDGYSRHMVASGSEVSSGDPLFKTITDEKWYVYLPLSMDDQIALADQSRVTLFFHDVNLEMKADFSLYTAADGTILGRCELYDYMIQLADKRYATVSIRKSAIRDLNIKGLKIPKTSVVRKEFYVIPLSYGASGGNNNSVGFYRNSGNGADFISPSIASRDEEYYYIPIDELEKGTVIRAPGNNESSSGSVSYTISTKAVLKGAYCANKGYAVFRPITVLDENADYYIVQEGQNYGLAVYDHIILNGEIASDGMMVY